MRSRIAAYALLPVLGLGFVGAGVASAHGMFGFGRVNNISTEEDAERQTQMFQWYADVLGVSTDEVKDSWAEGKNMLELMEEKGVDREDVQTRIKESRIAEIRDHLQALVDAGVVTREQADKRLEVMQDRMSGISAGHIKRGFRRGFMF